MVLALPWCDHHAQLSSDKAGSFRTRYGVAGTVFCWGLLRVDGEEERVDSGSTECFGLRDEAVAAVVAIPVNNERERIQDCLSALAAQTGLDFARFGVLLFLNNCSDGTAEAVEAADTGALRIRVMDVQHSGATAGWARRCAMEAAAAWIESGTSDDGVLLTSDADSRVAPDWVWRNLEHIAGGADAVAGRISLDLHDAAQLPERLHARGRLEAEYESLLTEIDARLDPDPADPWPCHRTRSGATLAVRLSTYRAIGGIPALPHGEDSAFVATLLQEGFKVRHALDVEVITSGRLVGRAPGGAADTMRLRCEDLNSPCDRRLERLERAVYRTLWRRSLRRTYAGDGGLTRTWTWAPLLGIARKADALTLLHPFGKAYDAIEATSPRLAYRPLIPQQLPAQIRRAKFLVRILRGLPHFGSAAHRGGTRPSVGEVAAEQSQPTLP